MRAKKMICMILSFILFFGAVELPVNATEENNTAPDIFANNLIMPFATSSFNMTIPASTKARAGSSFPLAAGETVTIKASYSPFSANVDVGLIAPDGRFYYFTISDGIIDKTIQVNESGNYTLQIRNNSNVTVEVAGFVNY